MTVSDCLSQNLIDQFVAGKLSPQDGAGIQAHLDACADCRRRVKANVPTLATPGPGCPVPVDPDSETVRDGSESPRDEDAVGVLLHALRETYDFLGEPTHGGQALIYKAIHKPTKMKVVLKILSSDRLKSAKARRAFEREVDLVAELNHPNIVRLHDSGITRGQYYFSMEYIPGKPLDVFLADPCGKTREIVALYAKICAGVGHAHDRGIIHSDLKPDNVLVDDQGEPHILDFGLARVGGAAEVRVSGNWEGTPCYMSPEQAAGLARLMTVRSDVYSLGVMLYEVLTGRFPYDVSGDNAHVIRAIQFQEPTPPSRFLRGFDSELETILLKCLAKDHSRRYSSAVELQEELQRWLRGEPIKAKSDSWLYVLRKTMSRHKVAAAVLPLLAVILAGFTCAGWQWFHVARRAEQRTVRLEEQWRDQSSQQLTHDIETAFLDFLAAFQSNRLDRARMIADFVGDTAKEGKAMRFLLDPNSVSAREESFRRAMAPLPDDPNGWFADLILGEGYLRQGRRQEAVRAYQRSGQALSRQSWLSPLRCLVKARLYDLAGASADASGHGPTGSEPRALQ